MRPGKLSALVPLIGTAVLGLAAVGAPAQAARPAVASPAASSAVTGAPARPAVASPAARPGVAAPAASFTPLNGFGSSWAGPAINQWSRDVRPQGIVINFDPVGSAAGRQDYIVDQADFAASDIAFLTTPDPFQGGTENPPYAYSYIPIVAGGTTFPYNVVVGGRKIRNMRLSGLTITKIFTGQITNWDNAAITHDYGAQLPSIPITVVTRSDGSGASYQFTRWMWRQYNSQWQHFCAASGGPGSNCGPTEFYPSNALPDGKSLSGSDLVANYIASASNNGAIGYDEYAYALNFGIPVVKVRNPAGYYSLPTPSNDAIALQRAVINENSASLNYLQQNLDGVYANRDSRTYPLSSYSYVIVPRDSRVINGQTLGPPRKFNTNKGYTLSAWLRYVLCGAQKTAGNLGYSPLPYPLVTGGFLQFNHIPGHIGSIPNSQLNNCDNPTYHNGHNFLIQDAPFPSPCDYYTAPLNCTVKLEHGHPVAVSTGSGPGGSGPTGSGPGGSSPTGSNAGTHGPGGTSAGQTINPNTGQVVNANGSSPTGSGGTVNAQPVSLSGPAPQEAWLFAVLIVLALLGAIVAPTALGAWLERRRTADAGHAPPATGPREQR
jgi:ABC-type phosphate transport system substrate-binding protein